MAELNVRSTALRSQLEGRLGLLERENGELAQAKQSLESELDTLNQRLPALQRQVEAYQKQLQGQQATQQASSKAPSVEKIPSDNPPTANIKPMASGAAPQRPPVSSSPGQVIAVPVQMLRTTPTASIRPMAMTSRTLAVQPTSVSVPPMASLPLIAITAPVVEPVRDEEPVAGPSGAHGTPSTEYRSNKKRTRSTEAEESPTSDSAAKQTRLAEQAEEEVEIITLRKKVRMMTRRAPARWNWSLNTKSRKRRKWRRV